MYSCCCERLCAKLCKPSCDLWLCACGVDVCAQGSTGGVRGCRGAWSWLYWVCNTSVEANLLFGELSSSLTDIYLDLDDYGTGKCLHSYNFLSFWRRLMWFFKSFRVQACQYFASAVSSGIQLTFLSLVDSWFRAIVQYRLLFHKNHHTMCATNSIEYKLTAQN